MNQKKINILLGSSKLCFTEKDRIGGIMYKLYHEQIDPLIICYEEALKKDINAINSKKVFSLKGTLDTKDFNEDLVSIARTIQEQIVEYRRNNRYDEPNIIICNIKETFRNIGEYILTSIYKREKFGITSVNLEERISDLESKYFEKNNIGCENSLWFEEHVKKEIYGKNKNINELICIIYESEAGFWKELDSESNQFGNMYSQDISELKDEVLKEIEWRQKYLKNPQCNDLVLKLREICEKAIFDVIQYTAYALKLDLNLSFFSLEVYQMNQKKILYLLNNKMQDGENLILDVLKSFPFEQSIYKLLFREYGDTDGRVTSLADFFGLDVEHLKKELLSEYILSLPIINRNSEREIIEQLREIIKYKEFLEYPIPTIKEILLQKRLQELDICQRTVRGKLYNTREEAEKVRNDYVSLDSLITSIDFASYNLLNQNDIIKIKEYVLAVPFDSDTFKNDSGYILNELQPVLEHKIQMQAWSDKLCKSREPWKVVEEIIHDSKIYQEFKEKFKYWNFNGVKKYYPTLVNYERPVLFFQMSLFGWTDYFVLTNKRGLHITKNVQSFVVISDKTSIDYRNGQLLIRDEEKKEDLIILIKYPEDGAKYFVEILRTIIGALCKCEESLFETSTLDSGVNNMSLSGGGLLGQFEGLVTDIESFLENKSKIQYCSRCNSIVGEIDKFCGKCGNKLR